MRESAVTRFSQAARSIFTGGAGLPMYLCGVSWLKSGEVSSSLARTSASVFTLQIVFQGRAVARVGGQPQRARQRLAVVGERQRMFFTAEPAMRAMGVVQLGIADAHLHIGLAHMIAELSTRLRTARGSIATLASLTE